MDYLPPGTQKLNTNTKKMMHIAIAVVVIFFGGFLLWAALAPLSSGIVVPGTVVTSARLNIIQSPQTAKIKSILVKEGEVVKKNQPLIILDDSEAKAAYAKAKSEYLYLLSMESRLQAQLQNSPDITFPKELLENAQDPYVSNLIQTQRQLFFSTMQNFQSQKNAILQNTAGLQSELYGLKLNADSFKSQVSILAQQISSLKPLAKEGYYPKNQFLDKERQYEELKGNLDNLLGQIGRIQTQIAENNAKLQNLQSQFLADTQGKLAEVDSQLSSAKYQYLYYKKIYESMTIKSPINGTVLYLTVHTIGAVAAQGQELLEILPIDSKFIIE
ncbi:MAG: HlyD family type I secretion periplasmic adaptor subunit, partial [Desulfurella sp.]